MDGLLFRGIYTVLILFQSLVQAKFFDKKDFNCNYNLIYPTFFSRTLQFLPLVSIKI